MIKNVSVREDTKITKNFSVFEFMCDDANELYLDKWFLYTFVPTLQKFRDWYNRPININSCYRTKEVNKKCGGSSNSAHLCSLAVDFNFPFEYYSFDADRKELFLQNVKSKWSTLCYEEAMYPQVNFYDNRFHLGMSHTRASYLDYRSKI